MNLKNRKRRLDAKRYRLHREVKNWLKETGEDRISFHPRCRLIEIEVGYYLDIDGLLGDFSDMIPIKCPLSISRLLKEFKYNIKNKL